MTKHSYISIADAFCNKKAFIPFITCGDPDLDTTKKIVRAMADNGADIIELGIAFSDPTAEGSIIQEANARALQAGVTTDKIFAMVAQLRQEICIPLVFMTYANVVFSYGIERFVQKMQAVGVNGLILADVPFEEKQEFDSICHQYGIDFINLIAPTSQDRIQKIAKEAIGFIYLVSSLGVTGMRSNISTDIAEITQKIKAVNPTIPVAVGFGISNADQVKAISQYADGAIVGSAIVKIIKEHGENAAPYVGDFVRRMKMAQG